MLRALLALTAISCVVALGVFGPRWLLLDAESRNDQSIERCDVLFDTCRWTQQGSNWDAYLVKDGLKEEGGEYRLSVKTNMDPQSLLAVLRGESMYMGEYPVPMTRAGVAPDGSGELWEARFSAPYCTSEPEMTWRIDLQTGMDKKLDMPVRLTFKAEGRA